MANYQTQVFQNEFLPDGGTDVNAIVSISVDDSGDAGSSGVAGEIIIIDCSGSMGKNTMAAARQAAMVAVDNILDGTYFAIVSGTHEAYLAYPIVRSGPGMVEMNEFTRAQAKSAINRLAADGGTAIGKWLNLTRSLFNSVGDIFSQKHALLLTDGADEHETPAQLNAAIEACRGQFQCDCRGIGTYWVVSEIRKISTALMGSLGFVHDPSQLAAEFASVMQTSMGRGVSKANLRVWTPQGAQLLFVRQVSPEVNEMTNRGRAVSPLIMEYPTGAWGNETREYHVSVRLPARSVGQEQLAARVQLVVNGQPQTQGLVKAMWSGNDTLTTQINEEVAHYTGQTELAQAIQQGLAAKQVGDISTATTRLGRAVQLADQTGNEEAASRLRQVVDVVDVATGTVRLRPGATKADEMALDTASTKTTRTRNTPKGS